MSTENKFKMARIRAEVLENVYERLDEDLKDTSRHYGKTGEKKQRERYNRDLGDYEKVFDENGEPEMEDVYDYIPYTEEEMQNLPDNMLKAEAIKQIMKEIEKLI